MSIFNQAKVEAEEILSMAQVQSWAWMKHKVRNVIFSFSDWLVSPLFALTWRLNKFARIKFTHLYLRV